MGQNARDRRAARRDARLERKLAMQSGRQEGRTARAQERQDTKQAAYKSGQNPNAFVSDLAGVATAGIGAFTALKGGGSDLLKKKDPPPTIPTWAIPAGIAVVALGFFMMKKK